MSSPGGSSSTARNADGAGSPSSRRTANQSSSRHSTSKSRMPRTLNTIPVWARKDDPSPPQSPRSSPPDSKKSNETESTLPRQPKPAHLNANSTYSSDDRHRQSMSSSDEEDGPSRFWSLSKRRRKDDSDATLKTTSPKDRRPSLTNMFGSTLGDAFSTMTSTLGGRTARQNSIQSDEGEKPIEQGDAEPNLQQGRWSRDDSTNANTTKESSYRRRQMNADLSYTRNQPTTPGWDTPWHPETRDGFSIEFGNYRYNNHGEGGYLPRTNTSRSIGLEKRQLNKNGMTMVHSREKRRDNIFMIDWWKRFLLDNPFVPLLFRFINIAFTTSTLAIAIRLRNLLQQQGAEAAVGSSPLVAIIFSPLTLVHVGFQIWLEYFSRPIGLWEVGSKLFYTLIDLIFVCLWSAELSISFDNYFTSTLVCTTFGSPYAYDPSSLPTGGQQILNDPAVKPTICDLQSALIGLVFVSLVAYVVVLIVSLYRIFVRVSRR